MQSTIYRASRTCLIRQCNVKGVQRRCPETTSLYSQNRRSIVNHTRTFSKVKEPRSRGAAGSLVPLFDQKTPKIKSHNYSTSERKSIITLPSLEASLSTAAHYVPLRLNSEERKWSTLLQAALEVSEYTARVDYISTDRESRITHALDATHHILRGLTIGAASADVATLIELARRSALLNIDAWRGTHALLIYMLQDAIQRQHSLAQPLQAVQSVQHTLSTHHAPDLTRHALLDTATTVLSSQGKSRAQLAEERNNKQRAVSELTHQYTTHTLSATLISECLYSLNDHRHAQQSRVQVIDRLMHYVTRYFSPTDTSDQYSLKQPSTAPLQHDHVTQYHYVLQTLTLWREITRHLSQLQYLADTDLLDARLTYQLRDTGQGVNRVQDAPRVRQLLQLIVRHVQSSFSTWVGGTTLHLADDHVPNALFVLEKCHYITRALTPLVTCLDQLTALPAHDAALVRALGGVEQLQRTILHDFCVHALNGSGAVPGDTSAAGDCVDGRVTSLWQWTDTLHDKHYYPALKLTQCTQFDV